LFKSNAQYYEYGSQLRPGESPMAEIHCRWEKGKETKVAGSYVELLLQKIEENSKFSCPKHCQKICEHKKAFSNDPMPDGFIFTALMMQLRNISSETMLLLESQSWVTLVDTNNDRYSEQKVCQLCDDLIQDRYKDTKITKNVRAIREGTKVEFFLFFPQLPNGAKAAKLRVESCVEKSFLTDLDLKRDVFVVWIDSGEKRNLTLNEFPMESTASNDEKHTIPSSSSSSFNSEPQIQSNTKPVSSPYSEYRLRLDLSKLPPIRITPITSIHRQGHDVIKDIEIIEKSAEESEPLVIVQPMHPRRLYPWSIEDRKILNYREIMSEYTGFCEQCENYGYVLYFEGLFLCATCRDLLHE
jgi:hypothetical protein